MSLTDSRNAIGAVTKKLVSLLQEQLDQPTLDGDTSAPLVTTGRPEDAAARTENDKRLNIFLYQIDHDGHLGNQPLDEGQPPPLWLALRYLLTTFDVNDSDTLAAHELLGQGLLALQRLNYIHPANAALADNPEPLKITFDRADAELLAKIMQGTDEKYRVSAAFQVRPVMIDSRATPSYAPLVRTVGPSDGGVEVLPSLGPQLEALDPERFEAGDQITLSGRDLDDVTEVCLGDVCHPVTAAPAGRVRAPIPVTTPLAAGSYPIRAVRVLASGRRLASNALLGHLLPTLNTATPVTPLATSGGKVSGQLTLSGHRLGGRRDAIFAAFYRQGAVALMLEVTDPTAPPSLQSSLKLTVPADQALPPGRYRIILRVNGEQAVNSPEVDWS